MPLAVTVASNPGLVHVSETRVNPPSWGKHLRTTVPGPVWFALDPGPVGFAVAGRAAVVVAAFVVACLVVVPGVVAVCVCTVAAVVPGVSGAVAAGTLTGTVVPTDGVSPAAGAVHPARAMARPTRRALRTIN